MTEPTILVPGFMDNTRTLRSLVMHLEQQGLQPHAVSPQPSTGEVGIEDLAAQLRDHIVANFAPEQPLNLVGFSMGGLICRSYVQQLGGAARTKRLITVATPHHGTLSAFIYNRLATHQMRPGSAFLQELNRDLTLLQQLQFTTIWTPLDLTILPATSALLPVGNAVTVLSPFHGVMLFDPQVLRVIAQKLREVK